MSFGDRPSGTIATVLMSKTAELGANVYPQAAKIIKENSNTDDLIDSVETKTHAKELTEQIEKLLALGGRRWGGGGTFCSDLCFPRVDRQTFPFVLYLISRKKWLENVIYNLQRVVVWV